MKKATTGSKIGCLALLALFFVFAVFMCSEEEVPLTEEQKKEKLITDQFSPWDGSHRKLERYIKDRLNDPDSYEHSKTTFKVEEDHMLVHMEYRAANAYNAKILKGVIAKVSKEDGTVLEIVSQN